MRCDEISELLAGAVDGTATLDARVSRHVGSCLRCQAELAQYRRIVRTLHQLRYQPVDAPRDLPAQIFARLDAAAAGARRSGAWARRAAYAGAFAATAGAAGAIALAATRNRRLRLAG